MLCEVTYGMLCPRPAHTHTLPDEVFRDCKKLGGGGGDLFVTSLDPW